MVVSLPTLGFEEHNSQRLRQRSSAAVFPAKRATGALMIEVMVCAFLLAVGILAVLAGQAAGVQSSRSSFYHVQAEFLVSDMVDRVVANAAGVGSYEGTLSEFKALTLPACTASSGAGCSVADRVVADKAEWAAMFDMAEVSGNDQPLLPSGTGAIEVDASNNVMVWVEWRQEDGELFSQNASGPCGAVTSGFKRVCTAISL